MYYYIYVCSSKKLDFAAIVGWLYAMLMCCLGIKRAKAYSFAAGSSSNLFSCLNLLDLETQGLINSITCSCTCMNIQQLILSFRRRIYESPYSSHGIFFSFSRWGYEIGNAFNDAVWRETIYLSPTLPMQLHDGCMYTYVLPFFVPRATWS